MPVQFSPAALQTYQELLRRYPTRQAALLPVLWLAQREFGWLSEETIAYVADLMELPAARVAGVVSFYTMYYRRPMGRYHLQVCRNLSCTLRGAGEITACLERRLGIKAGETTADGLFSLSEVECLASCGTAPMLQCNDEYVENLTPESTLELVERLARR
jgi:NADH-quinone oxidoreductase subunit E